MNTPAIRPHTILLITCLATVLFSCHKVKEKTKNTLTASGKAMGETASEFIQGVSDGVDNSLMCTVIIDSALLERGLATGKFLVQNDSTGSKNNVLSIYLIFHNSLKDTLTVRCIDRKGMEYGRTHLAIAGKSGEAAFYDFVFDKRTELESKSQIIIE